MRAGDLAWIALAGSIALYEIKAPRGELLSEACDRYRTAKPIATHAAILLIAGHLARIWPQRLDPLCRIATLKGRKTPWPNH